MKVAFAPFVQEPERVIVWLAGAVNVPAERTMFPFTSKLPAEFAVYVAPVPLTMKLKKAPEEVMVWLPEMPSKITVLVPAMKSPVPVASQEPERVIVEALEL